MKALGLIRITELAQKKVASCVGEGDTVVDATAGNGHDTLFLARLVGGRGRVYAFDVQDEALQRTAAALKRAGLAERVTLVRAGHETMSEHVAGPVAAIMFNLGYLPGGDRLVVTRAETTLQGLREALRLLKPGGLVTVVVYPGHREGEREREALQKFCRGLEQKNYGVLWCTLLNRKSPPELLTVYKYGD